MQLVILIYHISGASAVSHTGTHFSPLTTTIQYAHTWHKGFWAAVPHMATTHSQTLPAICFSLSLSGCQFIPIYMHVRVLVAAYLFQTGYGHFSFFWLKSDFGLYRVCQVSVFLPCDCWLCPPRPRARTPTLSSSLSPPFPFQVLFRLNFLVLVLCVVMDRPYQFYYFVPLVTFWFVVIYATLATWPQILQKQANGSFSFEGVALNTKTPQMFIAMFNSSSVSFEQAAACGI